MFVYTNVQKCANAYAFTCLCARKIERCATRIRNTLGEKCLKAKALRWRALHACVKRQQRRKIKEKTDMFVQYV